MKPKAFAVFPSKAPAGAEISGVDLSRPLDNETAAAIEKAFDTHSVIVFRNQNITPEQQLAFAAHLGELEINAFNKYAMPGYPGILLVSNIKENGQDIGYADAGSHWHSDMSYTARPPRCTMLYAREVPAANGKPLGDTLFASVAAAYDALSPELKDRLDGLQAVHSFHAKPRGVKKPVQLSPDQIAKNPDVTHPVVRTHPRTGRKCIYVREGECISIHGMPDSEALPLIKMLSDHCVEERFIYRHKWQVGDVLMWDNCAVQHIALRDYAWPQRRMMHRITVGGTIPV